MNYWSILVLALSMTARADSVIDELTKMNTSIIKKLVVEFRMQARKHRPVISGKDLIEPWALENLKVKFAELSDVIAGSCHISKDQTITLNPKQWGGGYDQWQQEQLFFHELGHCILNREHDSRTIVRNGEEIPRSVMFPYVLKENVYLLNRDYYLDELFSLTFYLKKPEPTIEEPVQFFEILENAPSW